MRFYEMIAKREELDRQAKRPKPYADGSVTIGHLVRAKVPRQRAVIGRVVARSLAHPECWVLEVHKSDKQGHGWVVLIEYHECHCERIRASQASKVARSKIVTTDKIYGDGDI